MSDYRNPFPTVDIIIELQDHANSIVLIERKNKPFGWALPGGFVDEGEALETAAIREAKEETTLEVTLTTQLKSYSDPTRDPRFHTISTVFIATAPGDPVAADDAENVAIHPLDQLPECLAFDHRKILDDYIEFKKSGKKPLL